MSARHQGQTATLPRQHGGGKSRGRGHGQAVGVGLYLLAAGAPAGRAPDVVPAPLVSATAKTAAAAGQAGVNPQSYTITLPAYSAGDLVLVHVLWGSGALGHPATPAGWTLQSSAQQSGSGVGITTSLFSRLMTGGEGTTLAVTEATSTGATFSAAASTWQRVNASTPVAAANGATSGSSLTGTWTGGSVSVPGPGYLVATAVTAQITNDLVPAAPAALSYDFLDSSLIVNNQSYRFGLAAYAPPVSGPYAASGGFASAGIGNWGGVAVALKGPTA